MSKSKYNYYKSAKTSSIYRTQETTFSDGTPTLSVERWNWDMEDWGGWITDQTATRKNIKDGVIIVPISKKESDNLRGV